MNGILMFNSKFSIHVHWCSWHLHFQNYYTPGAQRVSDFVITVQIAVLHGQYIRAVEELFEKHKAAAGFKDTSLYVY
jgi:hypothetical protein